MAEWLILLLLVPAIVVPVVLLAGFAGCQFVPCPGARVDSAVGQDVSTITVTWRPPSDTSNVRSSVFVRTNLSDNTTFSFPTPCLPNIRRHRPLPRRHRPRTDNALSVCRAHRL